MLTKLKQKKNKNYPRYKINYNIYLKLHLLHRKIQGRWGCEQSKVMLIVALAATSLL